MEYDPERYHSRHDGALAGASGVVHVLPGLHRVAGEPFLAQIPDPNLAVSPPEMRGQRVQGCRRTSPCLIEQVRPPRVSEPGAGAVANHHLFTAFLSFALEYSLTSN
jgi:hypothetical protein